jgi:hypothetical protein
MRLPTSRIDRSKIKPPGGEMSTVIPSTLDRELAEAALAHVVGNKTEAAYMIGLIQR